jgi:hypothetical protein
MNADRVRRAIALVAALAATAALVAGAMMAGDPENERMRRYDQERSSALQTLSSMARQARAEDGALPASLDELLARHPEMRPVAADPRTGTPYAYRTLSANEFELCAEFDLPTVDQPRPMPPPGKPGAQPTDYWNHGAGKTCWRERVEE